MSRHALLAAVVLSLYLAPPVRAQPVDTDDLIPADVDVAFGRFLTNRATRQVEGTMTVANPNAAAVVAPVFLVFTGLTPGVALANADGVTTDGDPFLRLDQDLGPGAAVQRALVFATRLRFSFGVLAFGSEAAPEPPGIAIASPAGKSVTSADAVVVSGVVFGDVSEVCVNGVPASLLGDTFEGEVPLTEGANLLVATAADDAGGTATACVSIRRDTAPPVVVLETPRDGDRFVTASIPVAGAVHDLIPGATTDADDVTVTVNGIPAPVVDRTFFLDVPLVAGANTLTAVATDRVGNTASTSVDVTLEPDLAGIRILPDGGHAQQGTVKATLPLPLAVLVENRDGVPQAGRPVTFHVSRGSGFLGDPGDGLRCRTVLTDAAGGAQMPFTLGNRTGAGLDRVRVTTPGSLTYAEFGATALALPPANIAVVRVPPARGPLGQTLCDPIGAIVTDPCGNPVAGVDVTFQVLLGGGGFGGDTARTVPTNLDGIACVDWTLGPDPGLANNLCTATFPGHPGLPAAFLVTGVAPGPPEDTSVSGLVQDGAANPIAGARARIRDTNLSALTGPDGAFLIPDAPPGRQHVVIEGSAANDPASDVFFPDLAFCLDVIPGVDNPLDRIVVLPFLDQANGRTAGGATDVTFAMEGVPGFSIKVFANSVIRPDGTRGEMFLSLGRVKFDRIPIPPPFGATPLVVGLLDPPGVRFDPPACVTFPNAQGLAPGDVADLFAFQQDVRQFVNIGPGTASEDGDVIAGDPGFGIVGSGLHGVSRVPGPTGNAAGGPQ